MTSDAKPLRVVQITDTHLFRHIEGGLAGLRTQGSFDEVLAQLRDSFWPADLILATGDIIHDGTEEGYNRFREIMEEFGVPTLVIPGNHDKAEVLKSVLRSGLISYQPNYIIGDWQFVMLDSAVPGMVSGYLADDQLEILKRCIAEHPDKHTLVALHHHPVSVSCKWIDNIGVENGDEFMAIVDQNPQIRIVLWGHIHQDFVSKRNNVHLIASPSTCIQFEPKKDDFALDDVPPGFRWLLLHADGSMETEVVRLKAVPQSIDFGTSGYE